MRARYSALAVAAATALLPAALVAQTAKGTTAQADPATRFFATAPWATSGPSHIIDQSAPLGGGPANDACGSVTPEALAIGGSLTFTGSTTGATNTGDYAPGSVFLTVSGLDHPTVWHAFTLSQTADVTVSYCNTNPGFSNVWAFLAPSCPADDDAIIASVVNWELCAEENITMVFPSLAAGTYYLPVMYNATDANGPYSIEVSAATFNPYCATWVNMLNAVEPICHVQFAGIDNTSCSAVNCGPALEDFTNTPPAEVVAGQTYALSVSGNTDGNYNNYISVFFDWDQDEVFDTGYGVGAIANTNCGQTATAQIPIPANVPAGTYRMRVVKIYAQVSDPPNYPADPCSEYSYGQAEDYLVNVSESGGGPDNDDCANATPLTVNDPADCPANAVAGDNANATQDGGDPDCDITNDQFLDVWYTFNSGDYAEVSITITPGTMEDLVLEVLDGCGGASVYCEIGETNNTVAVDPNTDYLVRVISNTQYGAGGTFTICIAGSESGDAPENDDCANATPLAVNVPADCPANAVAGNNANATQDGGDPDCDSTNDQFLDVWYTFNSGDYAEVSITITPGTMEDLVLEVLDGCGGASVYCEIGETNNTVAVDPNTDYLVRVVSNTQYGAGGTFTICIAGSESGDAPENDDCANATVIGDGTHAFSSENASGTDITSCTSNDSQDIWFEYVATCSGQVTATTCGDADFDTSVSVWTACGGSEIACNDDFDGCGTTSTVTFMATSGTSYWIRVAGYNGQTGTGNLTVSCDGSITSPENDNCGDVTPVALATGSSVTFTGTTVGASNVGDFEPGSELEGEAPTVWHAFTLSECANVTVSYCDTDPAFGNVWIFLSPSCPAGDDYILATNYNFTACPGNATITYNGLEAGTYYLPVMYDAADANGPYSIDVTAVACPPVEPYCTNVINFTQNVEPICSVQFAGIDNTSCGTLNCGPALEDFTSLPPAQVVAGQSYSLSVTGNTDGDWSTFLTVFFDWDQDGTFETSQEVGSIVNSACSPAISTTIDVPETAAEGTTRMRIIKDWASSAVYPSDPCGTYDYGQAEDYLVNVTIPTGVNAATGAAWNVFPNPNNGDFTITSGNESGKVLVEVLDLTGRQVHAEQRYMVRGEQTTFNMANRLAAGTYVLRLTSEAGRHEQRIVVR